MILQFKVRNFLSIREEQVLDFTASTSKDNDGFSVVKIKNVRISKIGVIYGANASGKSNLLKALTWFMFQLAVNRPNKAESGTGVTPFMLDADSRNQDSSFCLVFYIGDARYEYSVVLNSRRICKEEFYFYPNNRRALFYERVWNEDKENSTIEFGSLLALSATQRLFIESNCVSNATVLATYRNSNVEKNTELDRVCNYFEDDFLPLLNKHDNLCQLANDIIRLDADSKRFICQMLEKADFNISDIFIKENKGEVSEETLEKFRKIAKILRIPEPQDKSVSTEELFFTHKTPFYTGSLSNMVESEGTNRMYGLSALLFSLIKNDQTLLCDELENSLHYDLFTYIIKVFLYNSDRAQLIFTTHNLMLLGEEYISRDMVHFAEKKETGATEIFRATDFGLHKNVSTLNAYRAGRLGAKPLLGSIFIERQG